MLTSCSRDKPSPPSELCVGDECEIDLTGGMGIQDQLGVEAPGTPNNGGAGNLDGDDVRGAQPPGTPQNPPGSVTPTARPIDNTRPNGRLPETGTPGNERPPYRPGGGGGDSTGHGGTPGNENPGGSGNTDGGTGGGGTPGNENPGESGTPGNENPGESGTPGNGNPGESGTPGNENPGESGTPGNGNPGESGTPGNENPGESGTPGNENPGDGRGPDGGVGPPNHGAVEPCCLGEESPPDGTPLVDGYVPISGLPPTDGRLTTPRNEEGIGDEAPDPNNPGTGNPGTAPPNDGVGDEMPPHTGETSRRGWYPDTGGPPHAGQTPGGGTIGDEMPPGAHHPPIPTTIGIYPTSGTPKDPVVCPDCYQLPPKKPPPPPTVCEAECDPPIAPERPPQDPPPTQTGSGKAAGATTPVTLRGCYAPANSRIDYEGHHIVLYEYTNQAYVNLFPDKNDQMRGVALEYVILDGALYKLPRNIRVIREGQFDYYFAGFKWSENRNIVPKLHGTVHHKSADKNKKLTLKGQYHLSGTLLFTPRPSDGALVRSIKLLRGYGMASLGDPRDSSSVTCFARYKYAPGRPEDPYFANGETFMIIP